MPLIMTSQWEACCRLLSVISKEVCDSHQLGRQNRNTTEIMMLKLRPKSSKHELTVQQLPYSKRSNNMEKTQDQNVRTNHSRRSNACRDKQAKVQMTMRAAEHIPYFAGDQSSIDPPAVQFARLRRFTASGILKEHNIQERSTDEEFAAILPSYIVAQCQQDFERYYMQLVRQENEFQNTQYMMNSWNHGDCQMYPANYYCHDPDEEILGQLDSMDIGEPVRGGVMQAVTTTRGPADEESNIQQNMSMSTDGAGKTRQSQSDSSTLHSENEKTPDEADEKSEVLIEK